MRRWRRQRGWSMAELAARSGLGENAVEAIEARRRGRRVTVDELEAIAAVLFDWPSAYVNLLRDPDREEAKLESMRAINELETEMRKDPEIAMALAERAAISSALAACDARIVQLEAQWIKDRGY